MAWKDTVVTAIFQRLEVVAQALLPKLEEYRRLRRQLSYLNPRTGLLYGDDASIELTPYLAPRKGESTFPLRLGFGRFSTFWVLMAKKKGGYFHLDYSWASPEEANRRVASLLARATGYHPERVAALIEGLRTLQDRIEATISTEVGRLKLKEEYLEALTPSVRAITRETMPRLARYLREYALTPNPSPLLREALTLSLESIPRAPDREGSWGIEVLRIGPDRGEVVLSTRKGQVRKETLIRGYLGGISDTLLVYWEPPMSQQVLAALRAFRTRIESILDEAQAMSQDRDTKKVLRRASRRLREVIRGLKGLVREYPFAQEYLPKEPLVLELGEGALLKVDFGGGSTISYCTSAGFWQVPRGKELDRLLRSLEERPREEIQALVEFVAILAQTYREAHEGVKALLEGEEAQYIRDLYLAARIKDL